MICDTVLDAVGNTPLVRLQRLPEAGCAEILVKFEGLNVGGSIKTRTAYNMIIDAKNSGVLPENAILAEATSGNQGIGLALAGAVLGYRTLVVMPDSVSRERRLLMEHYGAQVVTVHDNGSIADCIAECVRTTEQMAAEDPSVFLLRQFANPANPRTHRNATALEILAQAKKPIHGFCAGVGTGGTLTGVGEILREQNPDCLIWAVEPEHAALLSGGSVGTHLQMGIGDGLIPPVLNTEIYSDICVVTDEEAMEIAKQLALLEGMACGISSGSNVAAALRMAKKLGTGKTVVTVLPDTAERYFSTPLFE